MKVKTELKCAVILIVLCSCWQSSAQQTSSTNTTSQLSNAIDLYNGGEFAQAESLLAEISTNSADYDVAQCYKALCLYQLKDYVRFLTLVNDPTVENASVPADVRRTLAFDRIADEFRFRRFEKLLPAIGDFQKTYPNSAQTEAIKEYRLAGLFERGMKKIYESSIIQDTNHAALRWATGKSNLEQFLNLAGAFSGTNYQTVKKRNLRHDVWKAELTLDERTNVMDEITTQDAQDLEKVSFMSVQLAQKLHPKQIVKNLQKMSDYISQFPDTDTNHVQQVQFQMASIGFKKGEALCKEADAAEAAGDDATAKEDRTEAAQYFQYTRSLQGHVQTNEAAHIELSDVHDLQDDLMYGYFLQKNYAAVQSIATGVVQNSKLGDVTWLMGKLYLGAVLVNKSPHDYDAASSIFDQILSYPFVDKPDRDYWIALAARWRVYVAWKRGNATKAKEIVQRVADSNCTKNMKSAFIHDYIGLLNSNSPSSN